MNIKEILEEYKVNIVGNEDEETLKEMYNTIKKRYFVRDKKYNVIFSKEFVTRYPMLTKNQKMAVKDIKKRFENCLSIVPYLSNNHYIMKASKEDELLTIHNIYHLHLHSAGKYERHVKRTNKLLFISYDSDNVYFLDAIKHPIGGEWNNNDIIEIKNRIMGVNDGT